MEISLVILAVAVIGGPMMSRLTKRSRTLAGEIIPENKHSSRGRNALKPPVDLH